MICSCVFCSISHVEDLSTLHIDELWMVWMNICQSPVFPLSPLDNHASKHARDFQHILQSTWRNCANALYWNFFYWRFSWIHRRRDWQLERKGRFLFLRTEVCLRELSLHLAQSSKFPSIINSSSINLDYAKRKNQKYNTEGYQNHEKSLLWVEILLVI